MNWTPSSPDPHHAVDGVAAAAADADDLDARPHPLFFFEPESQPAAIRRLASVMSPVEVGHSITPLYMVRWLRVDPPVVQIAEPAVSSRRVPSKELSEQSPQPARHAHQGAGTNRSAGAIAPGVATPVQREADTGCERRAVHVIREATNPGGGTRGESAGRKSAPRSRAFRRGWRRRRSARFQN
jgi:hypothetical protein